MSKEITPRFEKIGKRQKLVGFEAKLDGAVIGTWPTRDAAQAALDAAAYDLLH